jgi:hypothetical protein
MQRKPRRLDAVTSLAKSMNNLFAICCSGTCELKYRAAPAKVRRRAGAVAPTLRNPKDVTIGVGDERSRLFAIVASESK